MKKRNIILFFTIVLMALLITPTCAQVKNDTLLASQYFEKGDSLLINEDYISSITYLKKALSIYKKTKDWERVAQCYYDIGNGYFFKYEFSTALKFYQKTLVIREKILGINHIQTSNSYLSVGLAYYRMEKYKTAIPYLKKGLFIKVSLYGENNKEVAEYNYAIGQLYQKKGEYDEALPYLRKSLSILKNVYGKKHFRTSKALNLIGINYKNKGEYDKALTYYQQALEITNTMSEHNINRSTAIIINNIGIAYKHKGEYDKALHYCKRALTVNTQLEKQENYAIIINYNNIGNIYQLKGKYSSALPNYRKALEIALKNFDKNNSYIADSYNDIGKLYYEQRLYKKAIDHIQKALKIRTHIFGEYHPDVADSYSSLGNIHYKRKDYKIAVEYYQKGVSIRQKLFGKHHPKVAQSYNDLAKVYITQKHYQKALKYYRKAILSNTKPDNLKNDVTQKQYYNLTVLLATLQGQAKTYKKIYQENSDITDLKEAVSTYQKADALINQIRQTFTNYQDKVSFAKKAKEIYQGAIEAQLLLYKNNRNQKTLTQAFYYAEKSKANTLKEFLIAYNAKNFTGLPSDLISLEKELRINRAFYQSKVTDEQSSQNTDTTKITRYENKLFTINRSQDSLTEVLEKNYPKYYQLKHKNEIITVADIQKKLNERTTVLEFFTSDSITYAFTITQNKIAVHELATPNLLKNIEQLRATISSKHVGDYKAASHQLYQKLIAPVADQLVGDELIIIPDGPLWHLNVELLLTQEDTSNNPTDLSYVLRDYAISYANSANLLFTTNKDIQKSKKREECLAFSFTDSTTTIDTKTMSLAALRDAGDDLPGTRKEIKAIADIIDGNYYFGSEAIEANFKKNAGQYNILHLALHGEVDNERPENSKLYFTKTKDTLEDNLLYSHELFAMDIPAELTVLSACNTGNGKIAKGEGIMSLGTAFQYAGTKSLLLTSWEVSDQTTPELMKYFYTNLRKGMNKAKALQQAKLQYLNTADINRTHPFYWGGFYLVGDSAPIAFGNHNLLYWVSGLGILALLLLIIFWYRKKITLYSVIGRSVER